ncbi:MULTISPECIES: helix-turn-helix domain-containing protein [Serratia]|uniref:helix-turn-helix domain-containing protein n=1 Tax=Serratia TaxID=613 RepID=UPI0007608D2D|nr:helix-turn-helix domain-containing protein [Serratia marcescens]HEJ7948708.1 helix-turn-helix domain-containing protein [Serratia liquefaciens]EJD6705187.1 helix-turn-helix domain-containing protein [Serratia marcescens]HAT3746917.1 bacteriophage CI repressor [Serratia marcescens]HAT3786445.1 bacteriophage CI repressor [Serratia marcescens]HAT3791578.1 bacteriophage CI repressor [Serratia marcescens]
MNKNSVDAVLARLMELLGAGNDSELARMLDVNRQTLASWRKRDSIPYSICISLSEERGYSLDWLLTGRGQAMLDKQAPANADVIFSRSDLTLLELMNQLDPEVRKDLMRSAEEKQRMIELEKKVNELSSELQKKKNAS